MAKYYCLEGGEGCGFDCDFCGRENWWVDNDSFMHGEDNKFDEIECEECGKVNQVEQCKGCN
jgi:DNA-directed RNA polymerase subunit RPC12/RpoP